MEIKKEIGRRIKEARISKGYKQESFAELLNKSQGTISMMENGKSILVEDIYLICKELKISADWIIFGSKETYFTDEEKEFRTNSIQIAAYDASEVPMKIADSCLDILHLSSKLVRIGNPIAITDATVAALLARAALRSACYNVHSNLLLLKDKEYVQRTEEHLLEICREAKELEDDVIRETDRILG